MASGLRELFKQAITYRNHDYFTRIPSATPFWFAGHNKTMEQEEQKSPGKQRIDPIAMLKFVPTVHHGQVEAAQQKTAQELEQLRLIIDTTRNQLDTAIESAVELSPGMLGFVRRAFLGVQAPAGYADLLSALADKLEVLEEHLVLVTAALSESKRLLSQALLTPDSDNRRVLTYRSLESLHYNLESQKLVQAEIKIQTLTPAFPFLTEAQS